MMNAAEHSLIKFVYAFICYLTHATIASVYLAMYDSLRFILTIFYTYYSV